MIDAHRRLKHSFPGLLTLIAPRHPERGQGIADIAKVAGLTAVLRSHDQLPRPSTDIYVADTLGELGLVYRLAPIVFVGGSLVSHGGQNPIEAIKLGAAVLHGPHVAELRRNLCGARRGRRRGAGDGFRQARGADRRLAEGCRGAQGGRPTRPRSRWTR